MLLQKIHKKRHHSLSLLGSNSNNNNDARPQNSSKYPIYSNNNGESSFNSNNSNNVEIELDAYQPYSKRSKYDLNSKLNDQKNYSIEFSQETNNFKQDLMIISFESNSIHTLNKKKVEKSKQLTESENKLLGLANIALEREIN